MRLLIANRGELAVRILKTCKRLGHMTVTIYHNEEKDSGYLRESDFSVNLGDGSLSETYLNISKLISIAKEYNCDAIHPGYGFLSENHEFAMACEENNICFIGPGSDVIRLMASKTESKKIAKKAKIPVLGAIGLNRPHITSDIDFPIFVKAVAGGGGRGMKLINDIKEFPLAVAAAKREALQYFGNGEIFLEPYINNARHIEIQVLGDAHGNIVHLFERECSIQRNNQKIIEEAPARSIGNAMKKSLYDAAIRFARELNYTNVGTVEFLVKGDKFWFLEMNTRIQVEHPVTEEITGIDIVEEQLNIAQGKPLSKKLYSLKANGHAIESRIYAEDPYFSFHASTGEISFVQFPDGCRVDTFIDKGVKILQHFDSMLGKVIAVGRDRKEAIEKLNRSLQEIKILGVRTNIKYLQQIANNYAFNSNHVSTQYLDQNHKILVDEFNKYAESVEDCDIIPVFVYNRFIAHDVRQDNLWKHYGADNLGRVITVKVDETRYTVIISEVKHNSFKVVITNRVQDIDGSDKNTLAQNTFDTDILSHTENSVSYKSNGKLAKCYYSGNEYALADDYELNGIVFKISSPGILSHAPSFFNVKDVKPEDSINQIKSPLFGKVIDVKVSKNQYVKKGDILLTIESMKTENHISAPHEGIVEDVFVNRGKQVEEDKNLLVINPLA